jgi:hypothetical protein
MQPSSGRVAPRYDAGGIGLEVQPPPLCRRKVLRPANPRTGHGERSLEQEWYTMPRISEFFGISIYLYFDDTSRHSRPHFHAKYGASEAVYAIPDGDLLAGSLPKLQERLVQGWTALRASELEHAWDRAVNMEDPGHVAPLI